MVNNKSEGVISSIPSQKLIELEERSDNQASNAKDDPKNLSQLLSHRDNEISMFQTLNN